MMSALILVLTGAVYALFILFSWWGWRKIKPFEIIQSSFQTKVSIIIPARNEEDNILNCLNAIARQSYPENLTEVIIVDDASEDQTATRVKDWMASHSLNAKIIQAAGNLFGKKHALNEGIKHAAGELIVTTDADCTMGSHWLSALVSYYEKFSPAMICGMVAIKKENNFLSAFQSLEQLGLTAIGAAGIYFKQPLLNSGANLAYSKKTFELTGGYHPSNEAASGDDTQLMFRVAKESPAGIHFLKSKEAMVYTKSASTFGDFISQRVRWGSKIFKQKNKVSIFAALFVYLFHLLLIFSLYASLYEEIDWQLSALLFGFKLIPEIILLSPMISFAGKKNLWPYFFLSGIIYPFYLVITAILSQGSKYRWKNRVVR